MKPRLIVLNCYSRNALAVINSVWEEYELIGGDSAVGRFHIADPDRWFHSPRLSAVFRHRDPADQYGFCADIIDACRRYGAIGVIATGTTATNALSRAKAEIEAATSSRVAVESFLSLNRLTDKWTSYQLFCETGFPAPPTVLIDPRQPDLQASLDRLAFPVVLKPRISYASIGVEFIDTPAALCARLAEIGGGLLHRDTGEPVYIVQTRIHGELHDVAICADHGKLVAAMTQQRLVSLYDFGGGGIINKTTDAPETIEMARRLAAHVGWSGLAIFDLIRDAQGQVWALECNPKVWGTTYLTTRAGLNMIRMSLDIFIHDRHPPPCFDYEKGMVFKYIFPECLYHWFTAPRTPRRILGRIRKTFARHGATRTETCLTAEQWRHLIGILLNGLADPPAR